MWEAFVLYLAAFSTKWWAILSAFALFKIEPMVRTYWPWGRTQLEKLSPLWRTRIESAILIVAFFYAGFAAWSEEHSKWQTERDLRIASQASHRKIEIVEGLKGLYIETTELLFEGLSITDEQSYKTYEAKVEAFDHRMAKWILDNMGKPAWTRMLQGNTPLTFNAAISQNHNSILVALTNMKTNLDALIQNPAWDKP